MYKRQGEYAENEALLQAADEYGLIVSGLGNRQYVVEPVAPDHAQYKDEETYAIRKSNYDKIRAVFDDNIKDGTITPVYEICFSGLLSGETKYVYYVPDNEDEPFAGNKLADNNRRISELKVKLHEANEHRKEEFVERQRLFMENAEYSALNIDLSPVESLVFRALVLKRLPVAFKESIGCGEAHGKDFRKVGKSVEKNFNAIAREFIRSILSEKSVNFSPELAEMLSAIMEDRYAHNVDEIAKQLDARYSQSKAGIQAKIDELREENDKEVQSQAAVTPDAKPDEAPDAHAEDVPEEEAEAEPIEIAEVEEADAPSVPDAPEESAEADSNEEAEESPDAPEAVEDTDKK